MIEKILTFIQNQPVAVGAGITGLVQAIFGVLISFNLPITQDQQTSIIALITATIGFTALIAAIVYGKVTPVSNPKNNDGNKLVPEQKEPPVL